MPICLIFLENNYKNENFLKLYWLYLFLSNNIKIMIPGKKKKFMSNFLTQSVIWLAS